jgi:hypothetical protein
LVSPDTTVITDVALVEGFTTITTAYRFPVAGSNSGVDHATGSPPMLIVATTAFVAPDITEMLLLPAFGTKISPFIVSSPGVIGLEPTVTVATTEFVEPDITETEPADVDKPPGVEPKLLDT